jgi:hypothetical protein
MGERVETYIRENKRLPIYIGLSIVTAFFLGAITSRNTPSDYDKQEIFSGGSIEYAVQYVYDTVYIEKSIYTIVKDTVYIENKVNIQRNGTAAKPSKSVPFAIPFTAFASRSHGHDFKKYSHKEAAEYLRKQGFRNIDNLSLITLRRLNLLYNYDSLFYAVHHMTDFPVSFIYAYFILEATSVGVETELWRLYGNPGGIKKIGKYDWVNLMTIEYIKGRKRNMKQKFFSANNTEEGIKVWASVFNAPRYDKCRKADYSLPPIQIYRNICKCMMKSGYHTSPDYNMRADYMKEYWEFKKLYFPRRLNN